MVIHLGACKHGPKDTVEEYFTISINKLLIRNVLDESLLAEAMRRIIQQKFPNGGKNTWGGSVNTETETSVVVNNHVSPEDANAVQQGKVILHGIMKCIPPTINSADNTFLLLDVQFEFKCAQFTFARTRFRIYPSKDMNWPHPELKEK